MTRKRSQLQKPNSRKGTSMRSVAGVEERTVPTASSLNASIVAAPEKESIVAKVERAARELLNWSTSAGRRSPAPAVLAEPHDSSIGAAMHPKVIKARKREAGVAAHTDPLKFRCRLYLVSESKRTGKKAYAEVWDTRLSPLSDDRCPTPVALFTSYGASRIEARAKMDVERVRLGAVFVGEWQSGGF